LGWPTLRSPVVDIIDVSEAGDFNCFKLAEQVGRRPLGKLGRGPAARMARVLHLALIGSLRSPAVV